MESCVLLISFLKEEMLAKKAGNWDLNVHGATVAWRAGQARSSNLVSPRFPNTRGDELAFLRFAQLRLESLQTNINGTPLLATFSMKFK